MINNNQLKEILRAISNVLAQCVVNPGNYSYKAINKLNEVIESIPDQPSIGDQYAARPDWDTDISHPADPDHDEYINS